MVNCCFTFFLLLLFFIAKFDFEQLFCSNFFLAVQINFFYVVKYPFNMYTWVFCESLPSKAHPISSTSEAPREPSASDFVYSHVSLMPNYPIFPFQAHAHVMVRAPFLICAYCFSADVGARGAYVASSHSPHTFCKMATPSLCDDESSLNIGSAVNEYGTSIVVVTSMSSH